MKYGKVKREHGRIRGLDEVCDAILKQGPAVTRIVPGRISRRRGQGKAKLTISYATDSGLKCIFSISGTVQEVFIVTSDPVQTRQWLSDWITTEKLAG